MALREIFENKELFAHRFTRHNFNPLSTELTSVIKGIQLMKCQTVDSLCLRLLLRTPRRQEGFEDLIAYVRSFNQMQYERRLLLRMQSYVELNY